MRLSPRKKDSKTSIRVEHHRLYDAFIKPDDLEFIARLLVLMDKYGAVNGNEDTSHYFNVGSKKLLYDFIDYLIKTPLDLYIASIDGKDLGYMVVVPDQYNVYEILAIITNKKYNNKEQIYKKLLDGATNIIQIDMYHNNAQEGALVHSMTTNPELWTDLGFKTKDNKHYIRSINKHKETNS